MKRWTDAEIQELRSLKASTQDITWKEIAEKLSKSIDNCRKKYYTLEGVSKPEEKITPCTHPRVTFKAAVFDIEVTDFHAGGVRDHFICMSVLPLGSEDVTTVKVNFADNRDDRRVLKEARDLLSQYQILIGHYVTGFDLPWLNSRLAYHGMESLPNRFLIYDTYQSARRSCIKSDRKSLAFLSDFFHLKNEKTSIYPVAWGQIDSPDRKEFEYALVNVVEHCEGDVRMTRDLFDALWSIDRSMTALPVYRK